MRLIDADALKETLKDLCSASNNVMQRQIENSILHGIVPQVIDDEPTVDATPIKHGIWENKGFEKSICLECGARMDGDENEQEKED